MKCPVCHVELRMSNREGVEIDYCPTCRGVWLDRGELDKIIERSAAMLHDDGDRNRQPDYRRDEKYRSRRPHKRKSFWSELFDFD